jgi:hypothetical protein
MVYGKLLQNPRNYTVVRFTRNRRHFERLVTSPLLDQFIILNENHVLVILHKVSVNMDRPFAAGFQVCARVCSCSYARGIANITHTCTRRYSRRART